MIERYYWLNHYNVSRRIHDDISIDHEILDVFGKLIEEIL